MDVTVAVLAGGKGSRIGGDKALVELNGRPLITYPLETARRAGLPTVIVAKRATKLPPLTTQLLLEPDEPTHPLLGVLTALRELPAVIALPCDMPFVTASELAALAAIDAEIGTLRQGQPFPSLYRRSVLPQLRKALEANQSMRSTQVQSRLAPEAASSTGSATQITINTPEDLASAERLLRRR
jgi:molybdopterin-guanine dinucleotide biosynthesis protein A